MGIEDQLFQLKFTAKQLEKQAQKAQQQQAQERAKVKKALEAKNVEGAQIYAENAIRKKNEYLNYLRLSSRIDAVASKVKSAMAMQSVAKNIGSVTKSLESAMASLDLEKVSKIMDNFEKQFTDLDVKSGVLESTMSSATTLSTPQNDVDALIKQVAEENGLEIMSQMEKAAGVSSLTPSVAQSSGASRSKDEEDLLTKRLASLRN
jgi:charged multivesicular body protein 1